MAESDNGNWRLATAKTVIGMTGQVAIITMEASQIPGVGAIPGILKLIYATAQEAKGLKAELLDLSDRCGALEKALCAHYERIREMDLQLPLVSTQEALQLAQDKVTHYAGYKWHRIILRKGKITEDIETCKKRVNREIELLQLAVSLRVADQVAIATDNSKAIRAGTDELLRRTQQSPAQIAAMSTGDAMAEADKANQTLKEMYSSATRTAAEPQIAGLPVSRAQFNVVYADLVDYIHAIEKHTGQRPKDVDLEGVTIISEYAVHGVYTAVYCGKYRGKLVAVKALNGVEGNYEKADRAKKRLLQEFAIWPTLKHPNIHSFIGFSMKAREGGVSLVSPWQENGNIMSFCDGRFRRMNKFRLLAGAAAGLQYLHIERAIVHGGLKGNNILITDEGEAVITDFSVAAIMKDITNISWLSEASMTRSPSARWQAVEVSAYGQRPTFKSDIWSMAMTILEVVTEEKPFTSNPRISAEYQVTDQLAHGTRPGKPDIWMTDALWKLMEQCWDMEPQNRPDVTQVLESLKEAEDGYVARPKEEVALARRRYREANR